jgi:hypothetical protein
MASLQPNDDLYVAHELTITDKFAGTINGKRSCALHFAAQHMSRSDIMLID